MHRIAIPLALSIVLAAGCYKRECAEPTTPESEIRFGNMTVKDARNAARTLKTTETSGVHTLDVIVDSIDGGVLPGTATNTTYAVDGTSASTTQFPTVSTSDYRTVCFQVVMGNGSTPIGAFSIESSIDGTNWDPVYIDADRVYGENFDTFAGGTSIPIDSPAGTVGIQACVEGGPANHRLVYTRTSGGAASTIDAFSFLRAY